MTQSNSVRLISVFRNGQVRYKAINKGHPRWERYSFGMHKIVESDIQLKKPVLVNGENPKGK